MPALFEEGWFAYTPAWHSLGEVKDRRPTTWEEARDGYLNWEPETIPVYTRTDDGTLFPSYEVIPNYQQIVRSDDGELLSIQSLDYAVISNAEFGGLIEYIMGADIPGMPKLQFDALAVLKGGRLVCVTLWLEKPLEIPGDPSSTYPMMTFWTRHDGQGGMKGGASAIRIVCANTQQMSERSMDAHGFMFNIRHTKNWADRLEEARGRMIATLGQVGKWEEMAKAMASQAATLGDVGFFLDKWLPYSTDQTDRQKETVRRRREAFFAAYDSETCEAINGTMWGVLQAATEVADHVFPAHSMDTRAARTLLGNDNHKARALKLVRAMTK